MSCCLVFTCNDLMFYVSIQCNESTKVLRPYGTSTLFASTKVTFLHVAYPQMSYHVALMCLNISLM